MSAGSSSARSDSSLSIVILAAGQGKRMKSDLPKVLQPLAGKPLLGHVISTAKSLNPASVHVVYGHGGDRVRDAFAGEPALHWALQAEQLGTGHAVQQAMPALDDDAIALILYGDVPLIDAETLRQLLALASRDAMSLLTVQLADPSGYGRIVRDQHGKVLRIVEQKDATDDERAIREGNTGVMAVPVARLRAWLARLKNSNAQGEYYLTDIIEMAVAEGVEVKPLIAPTVAEVLGINDKLQLAEVEAEYRRLRTREIMLAGATVIDPARVDIRGPVSIGRDVLIDVNVVFEGRVTLGDRVRIGPHCIIRDCTIAADARINAHCVLEESSVGAGAIVGPFARLRPGAKLAAEVHIGNFVEVKNSRFGDGAKANHLAYVGDASVGTGSNIGAGTITCNYDGANKHRTELGDHVFIGSNSTLVAPIQIEDNGFVAAGSTITSKVGSSQLAVGRAKQRNIEGWSRPEKPEK